MKVLVIGSGLIGLTTAYFLKQRGHDVTVIDRQEGPARETSFANGALLTPSMPEPWNAPGCWRVLLSSLGRSDAALQLRLKALPALAGWGITFVRNSAPAAFERNTLANLRLALYSLRVMRDLREDARIDYGRAARGTLKVFRTAAAMDRAVTCAARLATEGLSLRRLTRGETVEMEPALAPIGDQLAGAIHYRADETGDAYRFSLTLAEHLWQRSAEFRFRTQVSSLEVRSGRVVAVVSQSESGPERLTADAYVIAAGSYSTPLLRPLGVRVPVRPAKGYSVTFEHPHPPFAHPLPQSGEGEEERSALKIPIVDDDMHAAVVPIGGGIRVAGTAEFAGFDLRLRPERVRNLVSLAQRILPKAGLDPAAAKPWCGLRPMSADGVPIIGRTRISNLWVNTGHGHLGWTMAAGSGELLADLMSEETPGIEPGPYDLRRFA
jgi:D-amino-acid dehydrogenase